jgi:hypothetical protein
MYCSLLSSNVHVKGLGQQILHEDMDLGMNARHFFGPAK